MADLTKSIADLIHVDPITDLDSLPYHPALHKQPEAGALSVNATAPSPQHPALNAFIASALTAAESLARAAAPHTINGAGSPYKSEGYNGSVTCERWDARTPRGTTETWAVRRSRHAGEAAKGDATYEELEQTVCRNHSVNEREYTPTVKDANRIVAWDLGVAAGQQQDAVAGWRACTMEIFESRHDVGPVLSNRVFTFLIITGSSVPLSSETTGASAAGGEQSTAATGASQRSFVVLSIPIELPPRLEGRKYGAAKNVVHGAYASVETVTELQGDNGKDKMEWLMATASDAKGNLPMALQKRFIKGEVAKDVGFVLQWLAKKRSL